MHKRSQDNPQCINRAKKGQFFVITAVAVILVLYGLSDFLKIQSFDATGVQGNALPRMARSLEDNLNKTVVYSPPTSVSNNLDELIALEKDSMKSQGYSLDVKYNLSSAPKTAAIIILYPGAYYEKLVYLG